MRQALRVAGVTAALAVVAAIVLPRAWDRVFPTPDPEPEFALEAATVTPAIEGVNLVVARGLGELGVRPEQIVESAESSRERDDLVWTYTRTVVDLDDPVSRPMLDDAFDGWPDGVEAFLTHPDELTYSLRVYVGPLPVHRLMLQLPLKERPYVDPDDPPALAVVLTGVGDRSAEVQRALQLSVPLTVAVLPYRSHALRYATDAARASKEVLVQLPFDRPDDDGGDGGMAVPDPLGARMDLATFRTRLREDVDAVPYVSGVLIESGTATTRDDARMEELAALLAVDDLFLLDARTSPEGVALQVARRHGLAATAATAAVDGDASADDLERALLRLRNLATLRGHGVLAIHLGIGDAERLEGFVRARRAEGYRFVFASELLAEVGG